MRPAVQEQKAVLVLQLHALCRRPPPEIAAASVQGTRRWLARCKQARSTKGDPRASVRELSEAIASMRRPLADMEPAEGA